MRDDYHIPVLLEESVSALVKNKDGVYLDLTFGAGGHSREILSRLSAKGRLYSFDQDEDSFENAPLDERFTLVHGNFAFVKRFMRYYGVENLDGVLADLGVSSYQIDTGSRGFSYRFEDALDMRMNRHSDFSAIDLLNDYDEYALVKIFKKFGDVPNARKLAIKIIDARSQRRIDQVGSLLEILKTCFVGKKNKYFAKVFQAIRIEVNQEEEVLKKMLSGVDDLLMPGGRLVVISYHSLEDRLVKNLVKKGNLEGVVKKDEKGNILKIYKEIVKGVVLSTELEIKQNSRARSAKLRVAEKLDDEKGSK